jgi:hypothetical protein
MLAYLDALCGALISRDVHQIRMLLGHPLARALPKAVREEALAIANGQRRSFVAPLKTLQLYHQTAHLLGTCADPATRSEGRNSGTAPMRQMELPLARAATAS